jgi:hypothetical protein
LGADFGPLGLEIAAISAFFRFSSASAHQSMTRTC